MCTKWFLRRLGPHSPLPYLKRLVCMEMNKTFQNSPLIEVPLYEKVNFQDVDTSLNRTRYFILAKLKKSFSEYQ